MAIGSTKLAPTWRIYTATAVDAAREWGIEVQQKTLSRADLARAEEVFFTNSLIGVQSINGLYSGTHRRELGTLFTDELCDRLRAEQLVP